MSALLKSSWSLTGGCVQHALTQDELSQHIINSPSERTPGNSEARMLLELVSSSAGSSGKAVHTQILEGT